MKMALGLLFTSLATLLCGCSGGPGVLRDPSRLDYIPVVSIQTEEGNCTGLLTREGTLVTCSHAFPRVKLWGEIVVADHNTRYHVVTSGDALTTEWGRWHPNEKSPETPELANDWAHVKLVPPVDPTQVFGRPTFPSFSHDPPRIGETLILVGYTREDETLQRYWLLVKVVKSPPQFAKLGESTIWVESSSGEPLRKGFSGSPLLRQNPDGSMEVCAMLVDAAGSQDRLTKSGVAISLPVIDK